MGAPSGRRGPEPCDRDGNRGKRGRGQCAPPARTRPLRERAPQTTAAPRSLPRPPAACRGGSACSSKGRVLPCCGRAPHSPAAAGHPTAAPRAQLRCIRATSHPQPALRHTGAARACTHFSMARNTALLRISRGVSGLAGRRGAGLRWPGPAAEEGPAPPALPVDCAAAGLGGCPAGVRGVGGLPASAAGAAGAGCCAAEALTTPDSGARGGAAAGRLLSGSARAGAGRPSKRGEGVPTASRPAPGGRRRAPGPGLSSACRAVGSRGPGSRHAPLLPSPALPPSPAPLLITGSPFIAVETMVAMR